MVAWWLMQILVVLWISLAASLAVSWISGDAVASEVIEKNTFCGMMYDISSTRPKSYLQIM